MKRTDLRKSFEKIKKDIEKRQQGQSCLDILDASDHIKPYCECMDAQGYPKTLYATQKEAKEELAYLTVRSSLRLHIYPCPFEKGWHLSKG